MSIHACKRTIVIYMSTRKITNMLSVFTSQMDHTAAAVVEIHFSFFLFLLFPICREKKLMVKEIQLLWH